MSWPRILLAACLGLAALASPAARAEPDSTGFERIYPQLTTWDLDATAGLGHPIGHGQLFGLARLRAGVLVVREPQFWSLGLSGEIASHRKFALGIEGGLTDDLSGLWTQLGLARTLSQGSWVAHAAVGYTLFGIELRRETGDPAEWQAILELRIPVGILVHMLTHRGS